MALQPSPAQPERGAALILGSVLGLILAGAATLAVGVWQVWRAQVAAAPEPIVLPVYSVPVYSADPTVIPSAPSDSAPDAVAAPAPANYYPSSSPYGGSGYESYAEEQTSTPEQPAE